MQELTAAELTDLNDVTKIVYMVVDKSLSKPTKIMLSNSRYIGYKCGLLHQHI
jgi:hypothetical protein